MKCFILIFLLIIPRGWSATPVPVGGLRVNADTTSTNTRSALVIVTNLTATGLTGLMLRDAQVTNSVKVLSLTPNRLAIIGADKTVTNGAAGVGMMASYGTVPDLVASVISPLSVGAVVSGRKAVNDGGGGTFYYSSTSIVATNLGTVFKPAGSAGRWLRIDGGAVNALWFGPDPTGVADSTAALQAALLYASTIRTTVFIPPGTYLHSGLILYPGVTLQGAGTGRVGVSGATVLKYTGSGIALQGNGALMLNVGLMNLTFLGTDGTGGIGLLMDSFQYATLINVQFEKFRNAGDTGFGIKMQDTYDNCAYNTFIGVRIEDSDTAFWMDDVVGIHATGYNYFADLVVYQEKDSLRLLDSNGNGSSYNTFDGLYIQGNGAAGNYLYIEGHGNIINGYNVDQAGAGKVLWFAKTTASNNRVVFLGGWDYSKYQNDQTVGIGNEVNGDGSMYHSPGKRFFFRDTSGGQTEVEFESAGSNPVEHHFGNDTAGSQAWRFTMDGASATPNFRLISSIGTIAQWGHTTKNMDIFGSLTLPNQKNIYMASTNGLSLAILGNSAANNVQLGNITDGGSLQIFSRSTNGSIIFLTSTGLTNVMNITAGGQVNFPLQTASTIAVFDGSQNLVSGGALSGILAPAFTTLADGATITLTCSSSKTTQNATVTLGGNRTLAISGAVNGMTGVLIVKQDATGSRTLTLPATSEVVGGGAGAVTLTATASAVDILTWVYDGSNYYWTYGTNFN